MDEWQAFGNAQSAASAEQGLRNITVAHKLIFAKLHALWIKCAKPSRSLQNVKKKKPQFTIPKIYCIENSCMSHCLCLSGEDSLLSARFFSSTERRGLYHTVDGIYLKYSNNMRQSSSLVSSHRFCLYFFPGQRWRDDCTAAQHHHFLCADWSETRGRVYC